MKAYLVSLCYRYCQGSNDVLIKVFINKEKAEQFKSDLEKQHKEVREKVKEITDKYESDRNAFKRKQRVAKTPGRFTELQAKIHQLSTNYAKQLNELVKSLDIDERLLDDETSYILTEIEIEE